MTRGIKKFMALICVASMIIGTVGCGAKKTKENDVELTKIATEVQNAYGENYVATYQFTDEELLNMVGVDPKDCEEYVAYGSMISMHVDKFFAFKVNDDTKETVKSALEAYQTTLKEDSFQYPMNIPKIQASEIKEYGNYLFFIMLGFADDATTEEEMLEKYKEQNAIAVEVVEDLLYGVQ